MVGGGSSSAALSAGAAFIADVGSPFPVRMTLTGHELEFTFLLDEGLKQWIELRPGAATRDGRGARYFVTADGRRIRVESAGAAVRALIVLPGELMTQSSKQLGFGRWQGQVPGSVRLVLEEIARMLARCHHCVGGAEPSIDLELSYRTERHHEAHLARAHAVVKEFIAPVRPVFGLRWRSANFAQRRCFLDELQSVTSTRRWLQRKRNTQIMGVEVELLP